MRNTGAFHVPCAAPKKIAVANLPRQRIGGPEFFIRWHNIGMLQQHEPGLVTAF